MDVGSHPALEFEAFRYDPARSVLLAPDGAEVPLRPKTFAMLRHMLANPGRLITREELLETIWPGVYVSDDSITQCIGEIRRALGEAGPRLLKTMPKRGYVFEATLRPVIEVPDEPVPPPSGGQHEPTVRSADTVPGTGSLPQQVVATAALPLPAAMRGRTGIALLTGGVILAALVVATVVSQTGVAPRVAALRAAGDPPSLALTMSQQDARRLVQEGTRVFYDGPIPDRWLASRALFERAIQADPGFAPAYAWLAFTYTNLVLNEFSADRTTDVAIANRLAAQAVTLGPDLGVAHSALGAARRVAGRFDEALASYRRAFALDPVEVPALANSGLMLILLGRPQEAIEPIKTAMAARPNYSDRPWWHMYLGLAELLLADGDFGADNFRKSLIRSTNVLVPAPARRLYLSAALALHGDVATARAIADEVRQQQPGFNASWFRAHPLSTNPAFATLHEVLFRGLTLAGVTD